MPVTVSAFYKFVTITDGDALRTRLQEFCACNAIFGTILIAGEGINATVAGSRDAILALRVYLRTDPRFADLQSKESEAAALPFKRLKVKLKPEIVTFGVPAANPARRTGTFVKAQDWNDLISAPDVVVVDTRNGYEVSIGTFPGARDPGTRYFSDFPDFVTSALDPRKHPKVAMFCTGGIRCEKASAYLLDQGFGEVYQLDGGILKYLETMPREESLFSGECFVFDERVALEHGVAEGTHRRCACCGDPVALEDETSAGDSVKCPRCSA